MTRDSHQEETSYQMMKAFGLHAFHEAALICHAASLRRHFSEDQSTSDASGFSFSSSQQVTLIPARGTEANNALALLITLIKWALAKCLFSGWVRLELP